MFQSNKYSITALSLSVLFLLAGCGAELDTAQTVSSGSHQIELLAPGGEFREGNTTVAVRVTNNGDPVELNDGRLDLHMPAMGAMPRMDTGTSLDKSGDGLEGNIFFEMDGGWQGTIEVTTSDGNEISESISIRVK